MEKRVTLGHGAGGKMTQDLINSLFIPHLKNDLLMEMGDSAILRKKPLRDRLAFTTDSFVVTPLFFPGGDIGKLAVNGTINDLVVAGAEPLYLSAGFILEEGLPFEELEKVCTSMAEACNEGGVQIVAADTKVVEKGKGDGVFINTSGVGLLRPKARIDPKRVTPGDSVLLTGTLGDHGISVFLARQKLGIDTNVKSDCAALSTLLLPLIDRFGEDIHFIRDLTRGGFATILNEMAGQSGTSVVVWENSIRVLPGVLAVCEMLGFDPLYLANEGKATLAVSSDVADKVLKQLRKHKLGRNAEIVGQINKAGDVGARVFLDTAVGGTRLLDRLLEDQLPRIC
jgi:hydrogenase expression/formation protein HypE